ncbi:delta-12 fatty acid desaturase [Basidiobolus meristosporus CBS 931.73]|uniref:Delta-12 fatty acid desaturase n=1 Tax=Basidiobolus meristosporus CBS 931.73 TaxID=1314790 RepID=A0A1Y1ZEJ2_9FUNG|nr:delta-12 fatty acid desaturase [Basidiobolus meristosporus CBS 931.73]|eukprot:ORY08245.1 delta-12 fatty acid desaturase [Basidiobolus meristosporus CBS 931.73]
MVNDVGLKRRVNGDAELKEKQQKTFQPPNFTIKELRDAVPNHCFERDTFRSFMYVAVDLALISALFYVATYIDSLPTTLRYIAWPVYWFLQGIVGTGVWVLAHECGHQAFSPSRTINNTVGLILHSALLVPYHSWRISHSKHHKATGHMTRDQVFVPSTRSELGLDSKKDEEDHDDSAIMAAPLMDLAWIFIMLTFGWPAYLLWNASGQDYKQWTSHFHHWSPIFDEKDKGQIIASVLGIFATIGALFYAGQVYGSMAVVKFYIIPYLWVNFWLVLITFLQHTDPLLPHYRNNEWNFVRGALATIDRDYGFILNAAFHHIADTHVAHHLFSQMPHYHAEEATEAIKKVLGDYYYFDNRPLMQALWHSWTKCRFVEDEGDVLFFKN